MAKLNQIIAIEKSVKGRVYGELTELNKALQKPALFNGFAKAYQPKDADGETLPPESQRVQFTTDMVLKTVENRLTELFDLTARKDYSNCMAKASVTVDGTVVVHDAPVSYLLFLEKQITDFQTLVSNLPVLDPAEDWTADPNSGLYKAKETQTHRTKKMQKPIVLYNATPEHPAQTQLIVEDIIVGFWTQTKMSGAIPATDKAVVLERVEALLKALKQAREEANDFDEVMTNPVGFPLFKYLLGGK